MAAALVVEDLGVAFGAFRALSGVSLAVEPGQVHAVIGPNGAGKTTLFNAICGFARPTGGRVFLNGRDITRLAPHRRTRLGLARTFQVTRVFSDLAVLENVALAVRSRRGLNLEVWRSRRDAAAVRREAEEILQALGLADRAAQPASELAHGDQRVLDVAIALALDPAVLLLDEPTAGMSVAETARIADTIRTLARRTAVLLVEHDVEMVLALSDVITVLARGRPIAHGSPGAVSRDPQVQQVYLGAAADGAAQNDAGPPSPAPTAPAPAIVKADDKPPVAGAGLAVRDLHAAYGLARILHGISLDAPPGRITCLLGRNGAGKTTTLKAIAGVLPRAAGRVSLDGKPLDGTAHDIAIAGCAWVPEERRIFAELTVAENLRVAQQVRRRRPPEALDEVLAIFPELRERHGQLGGTLSGGQQQMLAIARALVSGPRAILLDEPSEGLAPPVVAAIRQGILAMRERGVAVLLVEQNFQLALSLGDAFHVLRRGEIVFSGGRDEIAGNLAQVEAHLGV